MQKKHFTQAKEILLPLLDGPNGDDKIAVLMAWADIEAAEHRPEFALRKWMEALGILDVTHAPAKQKRQLMQRMHQRAARMKDGSAVVAQLKALDQADAAVAASEKWPVLP